MLGAALRVRQSFAGKGWSAVIYDHALGQGLDMRPLTLHPVPRKTGYHYWLGEYPLYLLSEAKGWHAYTPVSCSPVLDWLNDTGLVGQYFKSRAETVEVFSLALSDPGAPAADQLPSLRRRPEGRYVLDGRYVVFRSRGAWTIGDMHGGLNVMIEGSLWCAGWVAFYHSLKAEMPKSNLRPLMGFTHKEISLQRMVLEGVDRPSWANNFMGLK